MRWLADENVDHSVVLALRAAGHEVWSVADQAPGIRDDEVLRRARDTSAVLITAEKDFGELVFRQQLVQGGVLLIRLAGMSPQEKAQLVIDMLANHAPEVARSFSVMTRTSLRIRRLPDADA